jgi:hypothetical protein
MTSKEKEFISDGLSNEELVVTISNIIKRKNEDEIKKLSDMDKFEKLRGEFKFFSERYPMLFEMAIRDDNFPWDNLSYMLNMRKKIINDEMTSENASKIVGKEWFDKYVDVMGAPPNKKNKTNDS